MRCAIISESPSLGGTGGGSTLTPNSPTWGLDGVLVGGVPLGDPEPVSDDDRLPSLKALASEEFLNLPLVLLAVPIRGEVGGLEAE
jgi:hypothetical protein